MKVLFYCLLSLACLLPTHLFAVEREDDLLLKRLDSTIIHKPQYHAKHEQEIEQLKSRLLQTTDIHERYALYGSLFGAYLHYQADSAFHYMEKKRSLLSQLNRPELKDEIGINQAEVMGVMGMYNEAFTQLEQINPARLDSALLIYYYHTVRACYGWMADYTAHQQEKSKYLQKTDLYRDSILATVRPGIDRDIVLAEQLIVRGKPDSVLVLLDRALQQSTDRRQQGFIYYTLAEAYRMKNSPEKAIHYLALTAMIDLQSAVKEYASLLKDEQIICN